MAVRAPCVRAAANQLPPSSHQKPHATATRSLAPQHPETREEPPRFAAGRAAGRSRWSTPATARARAHPAPFSTAKSALLIRAPGDGLGLRIPGLLNNG